MKKFSLVLPLLAIFMLLYTHVSAYGCGVKPENGYGWLTSADYGEGSSLSANRDRYTEKSTAFTRNGSVTKMQRNGLMSAGTYGKVDDLTVTYSGNRISTVSDAAAAVTRNGSMDYPGGPSPKAFTYNDFGAMTSDAARGIKSITYDNLGNPVSVDFSTFGSVQNVYSATGERLSCSQITPVGSLGSSTPKMAKTTIRYRGPFIYKNGKLDMVLFPGGYATVNGSDVTFHYYTQDYLGNNRAVINGSTGAIEQTVAYYPYGAVIADLGTPTNGQPYKCGGKELITANGLNEYDFGARQYYSAVPHFTRIDPMAEKYYWLSPYLYCANNPVNAVDPSGKVVIGLDEEAQRNIIYSLSEEEAKFIQFNEDGLIDAELLNQSSSETENMNALKSIVNSDKRYYYATASQYVSEGEVYEMYSSSDQGPVGVTLIPNAVHQPSPDGDVHIFTSNKLSPLAQVENAAHELFGHAYFQELKNQGQDVNPFHVMQNIASGLEYVEEIGGYFPSLVRTDVNYPLVDQINTVTKQAKKNYQNRIKK